MDNVLQKYKDAQGNLTLPDNLYSPSQSQFTSNQGVRQLMQSQQNLGDVLNQNRNGQQGGNPLAAYQQMRPGQQASAFGFNAPITENVGQYQPGVEVFSKGITNGTGFATPTGTPVSLPKGNWNVLKAYAGATRNGHIGDGTNSGWGNSVLVQNAQTGDVIRLSHLSRVGVQAGQRFNGGIIGLTGATGNVTGPHLNAEYYDSNGRLGDILQSPYANYIRGQ